jgi:hypothetical protein
MKKLIFIMALFTCSILSERTIAQFAFSVNISSQPVWGPEGYDYVEYYYMPDIQVYYNVSSHRYIYKEHGRWVSHSYMPRRYRNYDLYHTRKVVMNEPKPYLHHNTHHQRYYGSNDYSHQRSIRDSREYKYYQNKRHPEHKQWVNDQKNQKKHQNKSKNQNKNKKQNYNQNQKQANH